MRFPRTFVFVDLSGFTHFIETHGDRKGTKLLAAFRAVARDVASARGVRIDKHLGDGFMAVAVERDDGLVFAMELRRRATTACAPLGLRIGIATGDTMLFEGTDYIGSAPNLASRLCDEARDGEALMPAAQDGTLPAGLSTVPHPTVWPRGFPEAVAVVLLEGEPLISPRQDTTEVPRQREPI
jgi:class 3 adenylate cyclase